MFSQDIFELQDDGFDGSKDELSIAQEVFYGNVAGSNSKRRASNGVASSPSEPEKVADILPSANSENSALTNQASSEDLSHKNSDHVDLSMKASVEDEEIDHKVHTKRIKLSVNELCSFKPYLDNATSTSIPMKKVVYGVYHPEHHSSGHILMCHVVESSSDGLTSSCYLLNKDLESNIKGNLGDRVGINGSLSCSDGSEVKQIDACKSIASPISQESSVTKLLVSNMSKKRSTIGSCPLEEDGNVKLTGKGMKHLSTVLRSRLYQLLKSEGWSPENQIRNDGRNRYIYRSPRGKHFRALSRVWYLVGNTLFSHNNSKMVVDDKQWTDITKFCSDLYDTLKYIENKKDDWKSRCALTCMWRLLDPFVNVVLVNRKIIALRTGNLVKTRNSNELNVDSEVEVDCKLDSENCDADSETQKVKSIYVSEGNSMLLVKTIGEDGNNCLGTYTDRNMDVNSSHISADVSDIARREYSGSLCDIPLGNADNNMLNQNGFCLEETNSDIKSELNLKKDTVEKSDKFLEFQLCELCRAGDALLKDGWTHQSTLAEAQDWSIGHTQKEKKSYKKSKVKKPRPISGNSSNNNDNNNNSNNNDNNNSNGFCLEEPNSEINANACKKGKRPKKGDVVKRLSKACQLKDDDLLVSAVIKKRSSKLGRKKIGPKLKKFKSKSSKKRKSKKGGCRLRVRGVGKGGNKFTESWTLTSERTVLSWLISTGAMSLNESIQYREPKDDAVAKDGLISSEGILCRCCNEVLSISQFKVHAGFNQNRPCLNLFTGSGRPFTLSLLEAWSAEYKIRKSSTLRVTVDEFDKNDDSCGICGDVGELLCCDHCPSTFHQSCLSEEEIPEGSWYCQNCICQVCGQLADDKESLGSYVTLRCSQCEKKYHQVCLAEKDMDRDGGALWFCGVSCEEVHTGLQSSIGLSNQIGDNHTWTLLRCIHDDQKVSSAQRFALKAECNSKLAVAATIMEECFLSMIDPRTGIDMIPQVVYNWGSEFARLDYHGFYTAVLEKNDILISVASIRVHGVAVAEMPLIATCGKYRRQGMCRRLLTSIEKMLTSLKVEMLVIAAISDLVETWTVGFGFEPMNEDEKRSLNKLNLMVFPGTIMLKKTLFLNPNVQRDDSGVKPHSPELRVNEDCIQHVVENQDNHLHVTEEQNIVETCQGIEPDSLELKVHEDHIQHLVENQDNYLRVTEEQITAETSQEIKPDFIKLKVNEDSIQPVVDNQDYLQITEEQNIAETSRGIEPDSLELKVNQDCSQENQDDCLQVTETLRCMDKTCPSNHIPGNCLDELAVRTNEICSENPSDVTKVIEAPEGRKCVDGQFVEAECTGDEGNKSISLELVVNPVKASEGIQKGSESKMRGILTSNVGTIKEEGKGNESMTMWDYWEECIGELEPLDGILKLSDDRCRYGEPIVVKERISGGEPQCVNVAEKLLSLNESQDGNVLP